MLVSRIPRPCTETSKSPYPAELRHRPGPDALGVRLAGAVGDVDGAALATPAPVVERADDVVVDDRAAVAEVGAEVGAVGVEDVDLAGGAAVGDQVAVEVPHRP